MYNFPYELMWEIGVEGDKFRPHVRNCARESCANRGCMSMTKEEVELYLSDKLGISIETIQEIYNCVNFQ